MNSVLTLKSQNVLEEKYKLALTLERSGNYAEAEEIYMEIYYANKSNINYFLGLARCKKALNKFSELVPLVEEQIQKRKILDLFLLAGEVHWKVGNFDKAKNYWKDAIKLFSKEDSTYIKISNLQSNLRQFQLAIETLLLGRNNLKSETLFYEDLIKLYLITNNYEKVIDEILRQFETSNDLNWAQAKISLLMEVKEARQLLENKLKKSKTGFEIQYKYIYAWFLYSSKDFERALNTYKELDELTKSNGYEVYRFGYTTLNDGQYEVALKAFEYIISLGKKSPYLTNAIYGIAKATDAKFLTKGKIEISTVKSVLKKYEEALKEISITNPIYFEIKYRVAQLYAMFLGDYLNAEQMLLEISKNRTNPYLWKTILFLGDLYLYQYRFTDAEKKYKEVFLATQRSKTIENYIATLKIGKLKFYQSSFDSAQYYFTVLIEESPPEIANEALERSFTIEKFKQYNLGLSLLAQSELLLEMNKVDSSFVFLDEAIKRTEGTNFEEFLTISKIRILAQREINNLCEVECSKFLQKFPKSIYLDEAIYLLGYSQYQQNKNIEAINTFTELITKFPRSIYNPKARLIINDLRKKES